MANFSKSNRVRTFYSAIFVVSLVIIYCVVNLVSSHFFHKVSVAEKAGFILCEESQEILSKLKSDVEIFVLLERNVEYSGVFDSLSSDIHRIMNEYAQAVSSYKFEAEIIDVTENSKKYNELSVRFGILPTNCIIITTNGKVKVLSVDELYRTENGIIVAFKGEQVISGVLRELSNDDENVIYFLVGHGEYEVDNVSLFDGLSSLKYALKQKNCNVRSLNLYDSKAIPDDADLVVVVGAKSKFLGFEKEILRDFIDNRNGRLFVAMECVADIGLNEFFSDYGISINDNLVAPADDKTTNYSGDLVLKRYSSHKINSKLIEFRIPVVFGATCEVLQAPWFVDDEKFEISELIQTDADVVVSGQEKPDGIGAGRIVAVISERKKFDKAEISINAGKLLVVGNSDFMSNGKFKLLGNRVFCLGIADYMLYGNLPAGTFSDVEINNYRFVLSKRKFIKIMARAAILPFSLLTLAMVITFRRRK